MNDSLTIRPVGCTREAIQWTGDNALSVAQWTKGSFALIAIPGMEPEGVLLDSDNHFRKVRLHDWIVAGNHPGQYFPLTEEQFAVKWEKA